jgi:NarL family two-component system sensor histidine kinase LiaS
MQLGAAQADWEREPEKARQRLEAALDLARQAQKELTALIQTLRPFPLESKGLAGALANYLADWREQNGTAAEFISMGEAEFPLAIEQAFFRIAQEALANIVRHSGARKATLTLTRAAQSAELTVADDGHGFDPDRANDRIGLRSMQERMQSIGGTLAIESGPAGTTVRAKAAWEEAG